jgi:hypothetical protein
VRVGWFEITIRMLGVCSGVQWVWPRRGGKREGCLWVVVWVRARNMGESFTAAMQRGEAGRVRYGLWGAVVGGGVDAWVWMCWIILGMVGLTYFRAK